VTFGTTDQGTPPRNSERVSRLILVRARFDDVGETLIEVLITLIVLSLCGVALIAGFGTVTIASSSYRSVATINNVIANASQDVIAQVQQKSSAVFSNQCPTPSIYNAAITFSGTTGYSVSVTAVKFWNGSSFDSSCTAPSTAAQLISIGASPTGSAAAPTTFSVVADARGYYLATTAITTPTTGLTASVGASYTLAISSTVAKLPATYTSTGSALPAGLSVSSSTGAITGTPAAAGTFAGIVVTVTDNAGSMASTSAFTITVKAGPTITTPTTGLTTSTGYNYSLPIASTVANGPGAYASTGSVLPAGLSVNSSTGTISGTPTAAGTFAGIVVTVTDNAGAATSTNAFTITVSTAPTISGISPASIKKTKTVAFTITGTGFAAGATVACTGSVTTATPTSISATQIVVNLTAPNNTGSFTCTVTSGGATSAPSSPPLTIIP
jgi:Putative Ig domain